MSRPRPTADRLHVPRDLATVLRDLLDAQRSEKVVHLQRLRRLHRTLERYLSVEPVDQLVGLVDGVVAECVSGYESMVLDASERVIARHPGASFEELASFVRRDADFRRLRNDN